MAKLPMNTAFALLLLCSVTRQHIAPVLEKTTRKPNVSHPSPTSPRKSPQQPPPPHLQSLPVFITSSNVPTFATPSCEPLCTKAPTAVIAPPLAITPLNKTITFHSTTTLTTTTTTTDHKKKKKNSNKTDTITGNATKTDKNKATNTTAANTTATNSYGTKSPPAIQYNTSTINTNITTNTITPITDSPTSINITVSNDSTTNSTSTPTPTPPAITSATSTYPATTTNITATTGSNTTSVKNTTATISTSATTKSNNNTNTAATNNTITVPTSTNATIKSTTTITIINTTITTISNTATENTATANTRTATANTTTENWTECGNETIDSRITVNETTDCLSTSFPEDSLAKHNKTEIVRADVYHGRDSVSQTCVNGRRRNRTVLATTVVVQLWVDYPINWNGERLAIRVNTRRNGECTLEFRRLTCKEPYWNWAAGRSAPVSGKTFGDFIRQVKQMQKATVYKSCDSSFMQHLFNLIMSW